MAYRGNRGYKNGRGYYSNNPGTNQSQSSIVTGNNHGQSNSQARNRGNKWNSNFQQYPQGQHYNASQHHQGQQFTHNTNPPINHPSNFPPPSQQRNSGSQHVNPSSETPDEKVANFMHNRSLFILASLVGNRVEVNTTNGDIFEGIFDTGSVESDLGVVLQHTIKVNGTVEEKDEVIKQAIFMPKDLECIEIDGIDLTPPQIKEPLRRQSFLTDTAISGHSGEIHERELVSWVPDESVPMVGDVDMSNQFVDENGKWDQFAANKALFNVETNYDELLYTTKIDRNAPNFEETVRNAERIANEITSRTSHNPHISEERGHQVNEEEDEEQRYSAVAKAIKEGKYVPPSLKAKYGQPPPSKDPSNEVKANISESGEKIISTQAKGSASGNNAAEEDKKSDFQKNSVSIDVLDKTSGSKEEPVKKSNTQRFYEDLAARDRRQKLNMTIDKRIPKESKKEEAKKATTGQPISQKKADAIFQLFNSNKASLSIPTQKKLFGDHRAAKPIEEELMGTFRQFVSTEKERVKLGQQAKIKKDKDGKVAELLKFSQTFKLKTPVPKELKGILSKDKDDKLKVGEPLPTISEKSEDDAKSETSSVKASAKLNAKAAEFKPNPSAKPFNPSALVEARKEVNAFFLNGKPEIKEEPVNWQFEKIEKKVFNDPSTQAPTWPTEGKPYRQQFNVTPMDPQYGAMPPNMYPQPPFFPPYRYPNQMPYPQMMGMPSQPMPFMGHPPHNPPPYPYQPHNNQPMFNHPSPGPNNPNYFKQTSHDNSQTNPNYPPSSQGRNQQQPMHPPPSQQQQQPPQSQGPHPNMPHPNGPPQGVYMGPPPTTHSPMVRYGPPPPNDPNNPNNPHYHSQRSTQTPSPNTNQQPQTLPPHTQFNTNQPMISSPYQPIVCSPFQHQPPFHPIGPPHPHAMGHLPPPQYYQIPPPQHYHQQPNYHSQQHHHPNHLNPRSKGRGRGGSHNNYHNSNNNYDKNSNNSNNSPSNQN